MKRTVACPTCGASKGSPCKLTLSEQPEQELSVEWQHPSRERANA